MGGEVGVLEAGKVADRWALGAADDGRPRRGRRTGRASVEDGKAGGAERAVVTLEDAGGAEATDATTVANVVERPRVEGIAAVTAATLRRC